MFMYWETPTPASSWNTGGSGDPSTHTEGYIATNSTSPGPELEKLSVAILEVLYLRDYSNPVLRYFSSTYRTCVGTETSSSGKPRSARVMRSDSISEQDFNHFVVNTTSEVDDEKGRANVWVTHRGTGFPPDDLARELKYITMADRLPVSRAVRTAPREFTFTDNNGRLQVHHELLDVRGRTRALQIVPNFDLITPIIALDCEFQQVRIASLPKCKHRVGRISIVNYDGKIIYDVFAYYPQEEGKTVKLTPKDYGMGVYWPDISPLNGALPVKEVEIQVRRIMLRAKIVVGHAIGNDMKVMSEGMFDGIDIRDTQLHQPWRDAYGKAHQYLPSLKVLSVKLLDKVIQVDEHGSHEDAAATVFVYRKDPEGIEAAQGPNGYINVAEVVAKIAFEFEGYDEALLEEAPIADEGYTGGAQVVEEMMKLPLSDAGVHWQKGAAAIRGSVTTNATLCKEKFVLETMSSFADTTSEDSTVTSAQSSRHNSTSDGASTQASTPPEKTSAFYHMRTAATLKTTTTRLNDHKTSTSTPMHSDAKQTANICKLVTLFWSEDEG
ncbi:REX4, RNA exonuclease 4 [Elasticomyces elasticus]|nr:REX4, RNA exonuclease 4 [Elasticomyces elasticus]KAK3664790.1 REX4, RNA exonuclease 4 [Elasticomyces elasticus]KAK4928600.1 REX4, RNA exonuclease 4 [Elasticomyces elasticus]KAK5765168.1 REX4, RNA exonuclease 4 [Elasticomyces elasticus]